MKDIFATFIGNINSKDVRVLIVLLAITIAFIAVLNSFFHFAVDTDEFLTYLLLGIWFSSSCIHLSARSGMTEK